MMGVCEVKNMSDIEEKRSLTSTEIADLLVQGMIAGLEQETPPLADVVRSESHMNTPWERTALDFVRIVAR